MAKIPQGLINLLEQIEEKNVAVVCQKLHITDTVEYKLYASKAAQKNCEKEYLIKVFSGGSDLQKIYKTIEPYLFIGGCAPGIGIAFNIVDACFCAALGNYLGAFVAIISCFPIPGFKVIGKGIEKLFVEILRKVNPRHLSSLIKMLGERLSMLHFHTTESYIIIREQIEKLFPWIHNNPFVEPVFQELSRIVQHFPKMSEKVSTTVCKTGEELSKKYSIQPKPLLSTTQRANYGIGGKTLKP